MHWPLAHPAARHLHRSFHSPALRAPQAAGDKLVVVEATSDKVCQTGLDEEAELHWKVGRCEGCAGG